jgi:hypothetical protein
LIGNIQEEVNVWSVKDSGVIIRKKASVAGRKNEMLYCLAGENTGNLIFGLRKNKEKQYFYAQN